jgi:hypothetical protein
MRISLKGTGMALVFSPSSLDFGDQQVGTSSQPQNITVTNATSTAVAISGINASGDYSQSNNCVGGLQPGAKCTIGVTFSPTKVGKRDGSVTADDSDHTSPQTIPLTGVGIQ